MKGKGGSVNMARNKKIVQQDAKKPFIEEKKRVMKEVVGEKKFNKQYKTRVLDRFLPKK